jgi:glycosyltransferase involved in cell wall biosynthesis
VKILYHHRIRSKDGQYVHLEELVGALREAGHEVVLVGPRAVATESFGADAGLVAVLKRSLPRALYEVLELGYSVVAYGRLVTAILRHRPDGIYERYNLFSPAGVWARRLFRLPLLLEVNAPLYEERKRFGGIALDGLASWSERMTWRGADRVLPVTRVLAERVRQAGVPAAQIIVVPNGIDRRKFRAGLSRDEARAHLRLDGKLVLGFVGFMREWHGLDRVIDILADHGEPHWHLLLVGDGPVRESLVEHARARNVVDRVTITGVVEREHIASHVRAFDVALQPAVVEYASPLKLIEYLAAGLAIVAPDTPNIRELLDHGQNGLLFSLEDRDSFTRAVLTACHDAALRSRLGSAAAATIERRGLTWEANARCVIAELRKLCTGSETPA